MPSWEPRAAPLWAAPVSRGRQRTSAMAAMSRSSRRTAAIQIRLTIMNAGPYHWCTEFSSTSLGA
eukprot:CAMPEP_0179177258 /NCGR_PEP_ID=MMETSP0796-20121207/87658_1 /TAXON_ID=73915 /ORGANISM="Pyrodinium bahamense, Strain pbaha01" /LENGTH=64 /DNA_ID=CAMNT_0020880805 /DNA_START=1232 /DNA_END=1426 /DNA_ORIENTATION=+